MLDGMRRACITKGTTQYHGTKLVDVELTVPIFVIFAYQLVDLIFSKVYVK